MRADTLRKSILQYAIQGKLVPQIETEESTNELLKKIRAEKEQLIKQGKIKKEKPLQAITDDEKPFDIPGSWEWVRIGNIAIMYSGNSINALEKKKKYTGLIDGYNYIATKDVAFDKTIDYNNGIKIPFNTAYKIAKASSVLLCIEGGSAGRKIGRLNQDVCFGNKLCCFKTILINQDFLFYYLQSPLFIDVFKDNTSGIIGGVSMNTLKTICFALPPLTEQHRIVARIEELMALVDEYENGEKQLAILEKEFPEKLKKSILQYAIQGKLVQQIETNEKTHILYKKTQSEKSELIKQGKIIKAKPIPVITDEEKPFDIPDSWKWVRLDEVCQYIQRGKSPKYSEIKKYPVIAQKCNQWSGFSIEKAQFIDPQTFDKYSPERILQDNDLLWNSTGLGTLGRIAVYKIELNPYKFAVADSHVTVIRVLNYCASPIYLYSYFSSPLVQNIIEDKSTGSTKQKELNTITIKEYIVPLPPVAEQQRIVARIEELFELVNLIANGTKLKQTKFEKVKLKTEPTKVLEMPVRKHFNIDTVVAAARKDSDISEKTIKCAYEQIEEFYDNKN